MKRFFAVVSLSILVLASCDRAPNSARGKPCEQDDRHHIRLEEGLKRTESGEFSLIVMTDALVSFQSGPMGKWQYYYDATNRAATRLAVKGAIASLASHTGHEVHFEDMCEEVDSRK